MYGVEECFLKAYNIFMIAEQKHFEALYPDTAFSGEIKQILSYVKSGKSCQLLGLPGAGRSELLELLAYNKNVRNKHLGDNSELVHFVFVDFSEIQKRSLFDCFKFLFLNLADSLRSRGLGEEYKKVNDIFRESLSFGDELVLFQGLKQSVDYLALEKKLTLIFLFSRFEEYIPSVQADFFRNLRVLRDRAKYRFSVVFSINRPIESLLDPMTFSEFYEYAGGNFVYIKFYDEAATQFLVSYLEKLTGKKLEKNAAAEILKTTGGFAKLVRLAVEASLAGGAEKTKNLTDFLLEQKTIRRALSDIWVSLTPAEQADIAQMRFDDPAVDAYLIESGLVADNKMQIPLFRDYTAVEGGHGEAEALKIVFDENTNSIYRGKTVLSDSLTSSEFRLLKYLLSNQDKVVERDEIISIVWSGVKSTAGITDQAVDQLIFRLRRKIEEDPNNPKHLQTVKGRGFKFVS